MIRKKGQGLPLNVIVVAALVLIVLVILVLVFRGKIGSFGKGIDDQTKIIGKECQVPGTSRNCVNSIGDCSGGEIIRGNFADCEEEFNEDHVCCEFF